MSNKQAFKLYYHYVGFHCRKLSITLSQIFTHLASNLLFFFLQAVLLAQDIRDRERGGRAQIGVVEGGDEQSSPELMKVMTAVLGQRTLALKEAIPDDSPDQVQKVQNIKLYQ